MDTDTSFIKTAARDEFSPMENEAKNLFLKAFDELSPKLFRFCLLRVDSRETAEDLVSQTFFQTWQYLQEGGEVRAYPVFLYRVLRNLIADYWRGKHSRSVSIETVAADLLMDYRQLPEEISKDIEFRRIIEAMEKLHPEQREILHWRFVDGLSTEEIAELTGKKPNAIYVSIYRSIQKLKRQLN